MCRIPTEISFAWWNTGLSHPGVEQVSDEKMLMAGAVVSWLINKLGVKCLALGEVDESIVQRLSTFVSSDTFEFDDGSPSSSQERFGLGLIYDTALISLDKGKDRVHRRNGRKYRIAKQFELAIRGSATPVHLFISHWRSQMWLHETEPLRTIMGEDLRLAVLSLDQLGPADPLVILAGDYNDEPFSPSLAKALLASRDRGLIKRRKEMIYNPFWRKLGEEHPHTPGGIGATGPAGTFFYTSREDTHWYTYDQMMFSRGLLGGSEWELNEARLSIVDISNLAQDGVGVIPFDHYPIFGVVEKNVRRDSEEC